MLVVLALPQAFRYANIRTDHCTERSFLPFAHRDYPLRRTFRFAFLFLDAPALCAKLIWWPGWRERKHNIRQTRIAQALQLIGKER